MRFFSKARKTALKARVTVNLIRTVRYSDAFVAKEHSIVYVSRLVFIATWHRLDLKYYKSGVIACRLQEAKQKIVIGSLDSADGTHPFLDHVT